MFVTLMRPQEWNTRQCLGGKY